MSAHTFKIDVRLKSLATEEVDFLKLQIIATRRHDELPLTHAIESRIELERLRELEGSSGYGRTLGEMTFQAEVARSFDSALKEAREQPLHVLLALDDASLYRLRWEELQAPFEDGWDLLARNAKTPFSFHVPSATNRYHRRIGARRLRALVLSASPQAERWSLAPFDAPSEAAAVATVLRDLDVETTVLTDDSEFGAPTIEVLCRSLSDESFDILHLICHGGRRRQGGPILYLADEQNAPAPLEVDTLIERLRRIAASSGLPHVVFLACCDSAESAEGEAFNGIGQRLVRDLGIPSVVAMRGRVSPDTARGLAANFYAHLTRQGQPDRALVQASADLQDAPDYTTPVLLSRLEGQSIFRFGTYRRRRVFTRIAVALLVVLVGVSLPFAYDFLHTTQAEIYAELGDEYGLRVEDASDGVVRIVATDGSLTSFKQAAAKLQQLDVDIELDLGSSVALPSLHLFGMHRLKAVDVAGCLKLTSIRIEDCPRLETLDIGLNESLVSLKLSQLKKLQELDLAGLPELSDLQLLDLPSLRRLTLPHENHKLQVTLSRLESAESRLHAVYQEIADLEAKIRDFKTASEDAKYQQLVEQHLYRFLNQRVWLGQRQRELVRLGIESWDASQRAKTELRGGRDIPPVDLQMLEDSLQQRESDVQAARGDYEKQSQEIQPFAKLRTVDMRAVGGVKSLDFGYYVDIDSLRIEGLNELQVVNTHWRNGLTAMSLDDLPALAVLPTMPKTLRQLQLQRLPAVSELNLRHLSSLSDFSANRLQGLLTMEIGYCSSLKTLHVTDTPSLQRLEISGCDALESLAGLSVTPQLHRLEIESCDGLTSLEGLERPPQLREISVSSCDNLQSLSGLSELPSLQELSIGQCHALNSLHGLSNPSLIKISFRSCGLTELAGLANLPQLQQISFTWCKQLTSLRGLSGLPNLHSLEIKDCDALQDLEGLSKVPGLRTVKLLDCGGFSDMQGISSLPNLEHIAIESCNKLSSLQGFAELERLRTVEIRDCRGLVSFQGLSRLPNLSRIVIYGCSGVSSMQGISSLPQLEDVSVESCHKLASLQGLSQVPNLRDIAIRHCNMLSSWAGLSNAEGLQRLTIDYCDGLKEITDDPRLPSLKSVHVSYCEGLTSLPTLVGCPRLQHITVVGCRSLTRLPELSQLRNLQSISIDGGQKLKEFPNLSSHSSLRDIGFSAIMGSTFLELTGLPQLRRLRLTYFYDLKTVKLQGLKSLRVLELTNCEELETIEGLQQLVNLEAVSLASSPKVASLSALYQLKHLRLALVGGHSTEQIAALTDARPDVEVDSESLFSSQFKDRVWDYPSPKEAEETQ